MKYDQSCSTCHYFYQNASEVYRRFIQDLDDSLTKRYCINKKISLIDIPENVRFECRKDCNTQHETSLDNWCGDYRKCKFLTRINAEAMPITWITESNYPSGYCL